MATGSPSKFLNASAPLRNIATATLPQSDGQEWIFLNANAPLRNAATATPQFNSQEWLNFALDWVAFSYWKSQHGLAEGQTRDLLSANQVLYHLDTKSSVPGSHELLSVDCIFYVSSNTPPWATISLCANLGPND